MQATLKEILDLVGNLDDSKGNDVSRERFRNYLKNNLVEVGQIRDYIEESLRNSGPQYNRAFQDLVNYLGNFLGFEVNYGRYSGVKREIGHDGHWISPEGFHIVIEVKSSEIYPIKTSILLEYINQLISQHTIPNNDKEVLGLYVVGKSDPEIQQLKNAIIAENRTLQLRLISVEYLISLAELMNEYDVSHKDVLSIIQPSGPSIDSTVDIMERLSSQNISSIEESNEIKVKETKVSISEDLVNYWLTPVKNKDGETAVETIKTLVEKEQIYAFGDKTPGRKTMKPGDMICFYESGNGVVAHAEIVSFPENNPHKSVNDPESYPWTFKLKDPILYIENPVIIDKNLRSQLDAFKGKDMDKSWAWLFNQQENKQNMIMNY
jgi:hypothetical protein